MTRRYDAQLTREEVLIRAYQQFHRRGYHATSMGDLLAELSVSKGALYHHYPSKKALCLAVIQGPVRQDVERTWWLPLEQAANTRLGIAAAFEALLDREDTRALTGGCPLNNLAQELALADEEIASAVRRLFEDWCDAVARRLVLDVQAGDVRSSIGVEETAAFIVAAIEGGLCLAKAQQDLSPIRRCAGQLDAYLQSIELGPRTDPQLH